MNQWQRLLHLVAFPMRQLRDSPHCRECIETTRLRRSLRLEAKFQEARGGESPVRHKAGSRVPWGLQGFHGPSCALGQLCWDHALFSLGTAIPGGGSRQKVGMRGRMQVVASWRCRLQSIARSAVSITKSSIMVSSRRLWESLAFGAIE